MRTVTSTAVVLLMLASPARGEDLSARALLAFQRYDTAGTSSSGFRQQYDLRLERAWTETSRFRIFVRADDFRGHTSVQSSSVGSRQIQPVAELMINTMNVHLQARAERIDTRATNGGTGFTRSIERTSGTLTWDPAGLPTLSLTGQRNVTSDRNSSIDLTDDIVVASLRYGWRSLSMTGDETYSHVNDPVSGYDRRTTSHRADLAYGSSYLGGRLMIAAQADAQLMNIDERALGHGETSVPVPQAISAAYWVVDETPLDDRDHPRTSVPSLIDGDIAASTGLTLGPDAPSFQNVTIDLGRIDRLDEIRVVVRDPAGNPLRNGGGPVAWDVYSSDDGQRWAPWPSAQTEFNAALSLYSVAFDLKVARWFKIVNFGVNADPAVMTEVQAYVHATIGAGERRTGLQNSYTGTSTVSVRPLEKLTLSYSALYNGVRQALSIPPESKTTDLEQLFDVKVQAHRTLDVRMQLLERRVKSFADRRDDASGLSAYVEYMPTPQLRATLEASRQEQTLLDDRYTITTKALHLSGTPMRSIILTVDGGVQSQSRQDGADVADRQFLTLTGNLRLFPSLRLLLNGSVQKVDTASTDPAAQILGPSRDNRFSADLVYRPGRPLSISARYGWLSGPALSGLTQRYHIEWYPFGDGTMSLGGAYDQDIDPATNRRSRRVIVNPRWVMNRRVMLDVNYTSILSTFASGSSRTRTLYATVTLSL